MEEEKNGGEQFSHVTVFEIISVFCDDKTKVLLVFQLYVKNFF